MIRRLLAAFVAVAALTVNATTASASDAVYDCRLRAAPSNGTHQGVLAGAIASPSGGAVGIVCRVTVNATTVAQIGGTGNTVAAASGTVSFAAGPSDVVRLCADWTDHGTTRTTCVTLGVLAIPPQVVWDTVDAILYEVWWIFPGDFLCSLLKLLSPGVPPVYINGQGDLYLDGEPRWDCPPYDIEWE